MLKLVFKEVIEVDVQYPDGEVKKFTFGNSEAVLFTCATGMNRGVSDLIPRDYRDYHLTDGTVLLNVPSRSVRAEYVLD